MHLRFYQSGDYSQITDPVEPAVPNIPFSEASLAVDIHPVALTLTSGGIPIACGGVIVSEDGTGGEVWLRVSAQCAQRYPIVLLRTLKAGKAILADEFGFRWLSARIQRNFAAGRRLAERFGFRKARDDNEAFEVYQCHLEH